MFYTFGGTDIWGFFFSLVVFAGTAALTVQLQCSQAQPLQVAETGSSGELKNKKQKQEQKPTAILAAL